MTLEKQVESHLLTPEIGLQKGDALLLGVSGGIDSMVLLKVFSSLSKRWKWRLIVAHLNHGLRGKESDSDEEWVREIAEQSGCEIAVKRQEISAMAKAKKISIEMAARRVRHQFFVETARKKDVSSILLGHHADDQMELFFLRLFRGSGSEGLGGMRLVSPSPIDSSIRLIRPFLFVSKMDLVAFAKEASILYREDSSNHTNDVFRNRIRNNLIPTLLRDYSTSFREILIRSMKIFSEEHRFIEMAAEDWLQSSPPSPPFQALSVALQREVIRLGLLRVGVVPKFDWVEQLRIHRAGKAIVTKGNVQCIRNESGQIQKTKMQQNAFRYEKLQVQYEKQRRVQFGDLNFTMILEDIESIPIFLKWKSLPKGVEWFDADAIGTSIVFRFWQPGDRFCPIGLGHSVKLQDYFTNQKVPINERRRRVLLATMAGELFWIEGLRIAEAFRVRRETKKILKLQWRRCSEL